MVFQTKPKIKQYLSEKRLTHARTAKILMERAAFSLRGLLLNILASSDVHPNSAVITDATFHNSVGICLHEIQILRKGGQMEKTKQFFRPLTFSTHEYLHNP